MIHRYYCSDCTTAVSVRAGYNLQLDIECNNCGIQLLTEHELSVLMRPPHRAPPPTPMSEISDLEDAWRLEIELGYTDSSSTRASDSDYN